MNPATTKTVTKMSSMAMRDWTKFRFSVARSSPATPPHRALRNILAAMTDRNRTERVPATAVTNPMATIVREYQRFRPERSDPPEGRGASSVDSEVPGDIFARIAPRGRLGPGRAPTPGIIGTLVGILYLVGTPIGNLEDITERAKRILGTVDVVAAEDTRRTGLLLSRLGIRARLVSLFEGNEASRVPELLGRLRSGATVAVVSDAGMPALSDPGHRLVAACVDASIPVEVVPGPSAAVAALVVSGLPTDRFVFEGFIPRSGKARAGRLAALAAEPRTIILFESPKRVTRTLGDLLEAMGDRRVAVARELTKLHQ